MRKNLQAVGSQLLVTSQQPEDFFGQLMAATPSRYTVIYQKEVCPEEKQVEAKVKALGCEVEEVWNSTLMHEDDMQPTKKFPENYTTFVKLFQDVEVRQ